MKRIHHFLPSAIAMLLAMASLTMFAFASETEYAQSQKFEDGFYMVVTMSMTSHRRIFLTLPAGAPLAAQKIYLLRWFESGEFWVHGRPQTTT